MKIHDVSILGLTKQIQKDCGPSNFADLALFRDAVRFSNPGGQPVMCWA